MRVGIFTESYDPIINGVSTSVKTLSAELIAAGHEPVVYAPGFPGYHDDPDVRPEVRRLLSWRTPFNPDNPFAYPPIGPVTGVLRDTKFDIVHTQQPFGMGLQGRRSARRSGVPLVSTFHTLYTEYAHYFPVIRPDLARKGLENFLRRYYVQSCAAVIVPSRETGRQLEHMGVPVEMLRVIPTGVPAAPVVTPDEIAQARKDFGPPPGAPVLLFVGRLAPEKNLHLLLDSFARLLASRHDSTEAERPILLFAGSGPALEGCEERARALGIDRSVRFVGFLSRDQLAPIYAASTVFVFPSASETQGVVLSEAQSHGLPCVVVNSGGSPEFVRSGVDAILVAAEVEAFAAAIERLLSDTDLRRDYSAAARESPLRPTPESMANDVIAVYREALESRRCDERSAGILRGPR